MDLSLIVENQGAVIPRQSAEPSNEIRYFDLKRHPEKLSELPDVQTFPEAGELVRAINSSEFLKTVNPPRALCEVTNPPTTRCVCHISVSYEDMNLNMNRFVFYALFDRLTKYVSSVETHRDTVIEGWVIPTRYEEQNLQGWCVGFSVYGYADSEEEARERWVSAVQILRDFIVGEIAKAANEGKPLTNFS